MSSSINTQTYNSSTFTTPTSNNIQYPLFTVNGISKLLQLDLNKINHQHNTSQESDTSTIIDHSLDIPPTTTPTLPTTPIPAKQHINKNKWINDPFGYTLINKTKDSIRILFQDINGLELSTTSHTLEETCNAIKKFNIDIVYLAETKTNWNHPKVKKVYKIKNNFGNEVK